MPNTRCSDRLLLDDRAVQLLRVQQDERLCQASVHEHCISGFWSSTKIKRWKKKFLLKLKKKNKINKWKIVHCACLKSKYSPYTERMYVIFQLLGSIFVYSRWVHTLPVFLAPHSWNCECNGDANVLCEVDQCEYQQVILSITNCTKGVAGYSHPMF